MKISKTLNIVFHYLKGYDSSYILQGMSNYFKNKRINLIGCNCSKIFSINISNYIRILDSHE